MTKGKNNITLYKELVHWKISKNRKPLLLEGARQVGKTYLLKEFADKEYKDFAYFEEKYNPEMMIRLFPGNFIRDGEFIK